MASKKPIYKSYIICSNIRSGSTLLCKALEQLGEYGKPEEYFHPRTLKELNIDGDQKIFLEYCKSIVQKNSTNKGIFGIKLHWYQLQDLLRLAKQCKCFHKEKDLDIISSLFPNPYFIYLRREDTLAQSVSAVIAFQSGQWEKLKLNTTENYPKSKQDIVLSDTAPIKFKPIRIYEWVKFLQTQNLAWVNFFIDNNLPYYELTYEDLISSFTQEMSNIIDFLKISESEQNHEFEMPTARQSNQINEDFIKYYQRYPKPLLEIGYILKKASLRTRRFFLNGWKRGGEV